MINRYPDEGQSVVIEELQQNAHCVEEVARERIQADRHLFFDSSASRHHAERTAEQLFELQALIDSLAEGITDISTRSGSVYPALSEDYVQQELDRIKNLRRLEQWEWDYSKYREDVFSRANGSADPMPIQDEYALVSASRNILSNPINNLRFDESVLRNALVAQQVHVERKGVRNRISATLVDTPLQIMYLASAIGAAAGSIMNAALITGGSVCAQTGGAYLLVRKKVADLRTVESDAIFALHTSYAIDSDVTKSNMRFAGIHDPQSFLGLSEC